MSDAPPEKGMFSANEEFPSEQDILNDSFEREEKLSPDELRTTLETFWKVPAFRQNKYIKNFSHVCQILGPESLLFVIERYYGVEKGEVEARPEVANNLLNNIDMVFKVMSVNPNFQPGSAQRMAAERVLIAFAGQLLDSTSFNLAPRARAAFRIMGPQLSKDCANNELLSIILALLHDPKSEKNNTDALDLIKTLNALFSEEYIRGFIAMDIIALLQSPSTNIRVEATHALFSLFHHFTPDFVETRFLPVIEGLAKDPNATVVTNFIKNVPALARKISFNKFEQFFFPKYIEYLNSKNRFQKDESLLVLGQVILSLTESEDESHVFSVYSSQYLEKVLEVYFDLPKNIAKMNLVAKKAIVKANYELLHRMVLLKKGDIWPRVKRLILATEEFESILIEPAKLEISSKLDSIAKVCDKLTLEKDLIVIIDRYYLTISPSCSQTVKQNTIKILSEVLKELSLEIREKYADVYQTTLNLEANKWRLRYVIAEQIDTLSKLFKADTVFEKIIPMYFAFCRDNCAVVRKSASRQFCKLFANLSHNDAARETLLVNMKSFGSYKRFVLRQSFVLMAESILLANREWTDSEVMDIVLQLCKDPVINVRLTAARLVVNLANNGIKPDFVKQAREALLDDVDQDLYNLLSPAFSAKEVHVLDAAFKKRKDEKEAAAAAEKARIDAIKVSKGLKQGKQPVQNLGPDPTASHAAAISYRQLLQKAFDLTDNPNAKELLEDLQLDQSSTPKEATPALVAQNQVPADTPSTQPSDEPNRDAHLQPFVDIDLKQEQASETPETVVAAQIDQQITDETPQEALQNIEQMNQEVDAKVPTPTEVAVAKEVIEGHDENVHEKKEEEGEPANQTD